MNFESHSQAGQDRFAWEVLQHKTDGTFLDIGANHPTEISNTYALEQMGWTGILVENDAHCVELLRAQRTARLIAQDATKVDWESVLHGISRMDYLSLDVDEASLDVLHALPLDKVRFNVVTLEHDAYRFGDERKWRMLARLRNQGYQIYCTDVCDQGLSFEIWAIDISYPMMSELALDGAPARGRTDWKEFFV